MKKFAAVIAVMALCSAPVMAAEQGGFFWPIGNAKSGRRIPGAERQRNDRRKRKIPA
ncbi:protein YgiW [Escherichia coli]|nr:protein YgiW [Escherichia coli]